MHILAKWETDGRNLQILGVWKLSWKMRLCWNQNTSQKQVNCSRLLFQKTKKDCQTEHILIFLNTSFLILSFEVILSIHFLSILISLEISANNKQIHKRAMEFSFQDYLKCFSFAVIWSKARV